MLFLFIGEALLSSGSSLWSSMNVSRSCHRQAALDDASKGGRKAEASTWRRRTHRYLDALFRLDPATAADFHHYQARDGMPLCLCYLRQLDWWPACRSCSWTSSNPSHQRSEAGHRERIRLLA